MARQAPKIDERKFNDLLKLLKDLAPHYTPEWQAEDETDPGEVLLRVFSLLSEGVIARLNLAPHKNFVAFLDMLGINLLPALPARVPLTFKLAEGPEEGSVREIFVPQRTQATADATNEREEELPFETEKPLLATPSQLTKVISVDPLKDAIYQSPPGFLERELPIDSQPAYKIFSFSAAGTDSFQLDNVAGLEEGDLLKVGEREQAEFFFISEIKGSIIKVKDKLTRDVQPGTPVEKVIDFELFESKDLQEHILYIGHPELFNVKSPAAFTINIRHFAGTDAGVQPLEISWEYWGETEGEEGEDWRAFEVDSDTTAKMSQDGCIKLIKPTEGEIKELEINATNSRWIRAKLATPLLVNEDRQLPVLDNLTFLVKSAGDALSPDLAFHNDTPLDFALQFFPFGLEPRLFDRFSIASKEVFSKKGALIKLDIGLDSLAILAAPTAIFDGSSVRVFARGTAGRLLEFRIDPVTNQSIGLFDHGTPPDTKIALPDPKGIGTEASFAVVTYGSGAMGIFVKAENGHLFEFLEDGDNSLWIDHNMPGGDIEVMFDPSAPANEARVFVVAADGNLYELVKNSITEPGILETRQPSPPAPLESSPFAISDSSVNVLKVFAKGSNGEILEWDGNANLANRWKAYRAFTVGEGSESIIVKPKTRPFASLKNDGQAKVFYIADEAQKETGEQLIEFETSVEETTLAVEIARLGKPPGTTIGSNPHGFLLNPSKDLDSDEGRHIFVRGEDNKLYERVDDEDGNWISHEPPIDIELRHSPFALLFSEEVLEYSIFSSTNKNSILELKIPPLQGKAQVGTNQTITLGINSDSIPQNVKDILNDSSTKFIEIIKDGAVTQFKQIGSYRNDFNLAILKGNETWDEIPDTDSKYMIKESLLIGDVLSAGSTFIILANTASGVPGAYNGFEIIIDDPDANHPPEIRITDFFITLGKISGADLTLHFAFVNKKWDHEKVPGEGTSYKIITQIEGEAQESKAAHVQFKEDPGVPSISQLYENRTIAIEGESQTIVRYDEERRTATVEMNWDKVPDSGTEFEVIALQGTDFTATNPTVTLDEKATDIVNPIDFTVKIGGELYEILFFDQVERKVTVERALDPEPGLNEAYEIDPALSGTVNEIKIVPGGGTEIRINTNVSDKSNAYVGFLITIKDLTANTINSYKIVAYEYNQNDKVGLVTIEDEISSNSNHVYEFKVEPLSGTIKEFVPKPTIEFDPAGVPDVEGLYNGLKIIVFKENSPPIENVIVNYVDLSADVELAWGAVPPDKAHFDYKILINGHVEEASDAYIVLGPVVLGPDFSENSGAYDKLKIEISGVTPDREIKEYDGASKKAFVKPNWEIDNIPPKDAEFTIGNHEGAAISGGLSSVTIANSIDPQEFAEDIKNGKVEIKLNQQGSQDFFSRVVTQIIEKQDGSAILNVNEVWEQGRKPNNTYDFRLTKTLINDGIPSVGTLNTLTIADHGITDANDLTNDGHIQIISGPGANGPHEIAAYHTQFRIITVTSPWAVAAFPTSDSLYQISSDVLGGAVFTILEDPDATPVTPELSWEYFDGQGWVAFRKDVHDFNDGTDNLLKDGEVTFCLPENLEAAEVSGQENLWIRSRIVGGDYGRETFTLEERVKGVDPGGPPSDIIKETKLVPNKNPITPPIIIRLKLSYNLKKPVFPEQCFPFNNLQFIDQTDANKTEDKRFSPFEKLEDADKTLYLGFAQHFQGGPIKIFFAAQEVKFTEAEKPKMVWFYRGEDKWKRLSFDDATEGLIKQEILELVGEQDFSVARRFGRDLFWIRGTLTEGQYDELPIVKGIYPNTTWTFQAETILNEILGSSDGEPKQTFQFFKFPIYQDSQVVRVAEVLTLEEREELIGKFGEEVIEEETDDNGELINIWVEWREVLGLFDSDETDRHYILDRATGKLQFGDGRNGRISPIGLDNIQAFTYQAVVGGAEGNVQKGEIQTLVTAIDGVDAVINTVDAGGGTDTATLEQMLRFGPAMISHRGRAVTVEDFEWLAREASREIAKVRCRANVNRLGQAEIGWVSVHIVPNLPNIDAPMPSLELRRSVQRYLQARSANTVSSVNHIFVTGPQYQRIDVSVELIVESIDVAAKVDREVRKRLKKFFHPLIGGPSNEGWQFGRDVSASDVYVLLEDVAGVDHVEDLKFGTNGSARTDIVKIETNNLVANGEHTINIKLKEV